MRHLFNEHKARFLGRLVMYRKITLIIALGFSFVLKAQTLHGQISTNADVFQKEIPKMVINTDLLLTGERLHYRTDIHTGSNTASSLSQIAYVSLRTDKDSVVFNHKLRLRKGSGHGTFFIPATLKTGIYRLLGHTNFSLNNTENAFAHRTVYIINPFIKMPAETKKDSTRLREVLSLGDIVSRGSEKPQANSISIRTDRSSYGAREKILLHIENPMGKFGYGNYILSVRLVEPVQPMGTIPPKGRAGGEKGKLFHIPELRGEIISGEVRTLANGTPAKDKVVALSVPGRNYVFKTAKTGPNGRFYISIEEPYETNSAIVQLIEPNRKQYKLVLDKKAVGFAAGGTLPLLQLDPNLKEWLEERSIQLQIENAYFKNDSTALESEGSATPFYGNLATEFILDDYTRFPSLEETFVEVVTLARIRNRAGKNVFEVFDPADPYKTGPFRSLDPVLLVDGILVQDAEEIFRYGAKDFESIGVFPNAYRYGPKIFWGIIDFKTKKGDFKPTQDGPYVQAFDLMRPLSDKKFTSPDHSTESFTRIPDYRRQLYWEPNTELSEEVLTRSFYTSDVRGTYLITLEGYTDKGKHLLAKHHFEVE